MPETGALDRGRLGAWVLSFGHMSVKHLWVTQMKLFT